jgi:hypothetical protein
MASTAARAALARAVEHLNANDRNILTMHGRYGRQAVMEWVKCDEGKADAELARIKAKLAPIVARELRKPPELPSSSGLAPPERMTMAADRPLLRSRGEIKANTPARKVKPGNFKPKPCRECGEEFKPHAPRQVICDECRGIPPVTLSQSEPAPRAPDPPPVEATPTPASSNGHTRAFPALRDELAAIQRQINSFAARFDALLETETHE